MLTFLVAGGEQHRLGDVAAVFGIVDDQYTHDRLLLISDRLDKSPASSLPGSRSIRANNRQFAFS